MDKQSIDRINELAAISKQRELTEAEAQERHELRQKYLEQFRNSFKSQLENTVIKYEDGTTKKLTEIKNDKTNEA